MCERNRLLDCAHFYQRYLFIKEWFLKNTYCHRSGFPLFHSYKNPAQTYSFLIVTQVLVYTDFHESSRISDFIYTLQGASYMLSFLGSSGFKKPVNILVVCCFFWLSRRIFKQVHRISSELELEMIRNII